MNDDILGEPDGETGGEEGVGCVGQVISLYPYVPINVLLHIPTHSGHPKGFEAALVKAKGDAKQRGTLVQIQLDFEGSRE